MKLKLAWLVIVDVRVGHLRVELVMLCYELSQAKSK